MFRRTSDIHDDDFWGAMIAPYLAAKLVENYQMEVYPDVSLIPPDLECYTNKILTLLLQKRSDESVSRVYLWIGSRDDAKAANCLLEDATNPGGHVGKYCTVQTVLPHDFELFNKYEIIEESSESGNFKDLDINKIVASTPPGVKKMNTEVLMDLVQKSVEKFVIKLMELEDAGNEVIGMYNTTRVMRRGKSTVFKETDILIGDPAEIEALREEDESDDSDSDYSSEGSESEGSEGSEDDDESEGSESEGSTESEGSESEGSESEGSESDGTEDEGSESEGSSSESEGESEGSSTESEGSEGSEGTVDAQIDALIPLHNKLVRAMRASSEGVFGLHGKPKTEVTPEILGLLQELLLIGEISEDFRPTDEDEADEDEAEGDEAEGDDAEGDEGTEGTEESDAAVRIVMQALGKFEFEKNVAPSKKKPVEELPEAEVVVEKSVEDVASDSEPVKTVKPRRRSLEDEDD